MRTPRRAFIEGAMVVLLIGAIALLVFGIVHKLQESAHPLAGRYFHPAVAAVLVLLLFCLVVRLLVRSAAGRQARHLLADRLFEKIPG